MLHAVLPPSYATGSAAIPARETQRNWSDSVLSAAARRFASYTEKAGLKPSNKPTADDAPKPATAWLRQASSSIVDDLIPHARGVAVLEFHTGLRPYGDIAIASCHAATSDGSERLKSWYGENVETDSAAVLDLFALGFGDRLAELPLTAAHIEFGVYSMQGILQLDARKSSTARHSDMRALFSPQSREWSEHIASEGARLIASALKGLAAT